MKIKISIMFICLIIAFYLLSLQYGSWEENLSANFSIQMRDEPEIQLVQPISNCTIAAPAEVVTQPAQIDDQAVTETNNTGAAQGEVDMSGEAAMTPGDAPVTEEADESTQNGDQVLVDNSGDEQGPKTELQSSDNGDTEENQTEAGGESMNNTNE